MKNLIKEQISQDEKTRILELHNILKKSELNKKNRKSLNEQIKPPVDQEEYMENVKLKCAGFKNAVVWTVPNENIAFLYIEDDKKYQYWYSVDGTYNIVVQNKDGIREIVKENLKWYCKEITKSEYEKSPETLDTKNLVEAGWSNIQALRESGITIDEIYLLWERHPQYKDYLKPKYASNRTGTFNPNQQKFVNYWSTQINNGIDEGMFMVNPTTDGFISGGWDMDKSFIAPDSKNFFVGGLKVYYNTNKKTEPTRQMCKTVIKKFADEYNRNRTATKITKDTFTKKVYIQDCIYKFKEFDRPLSGVKDELNLLGGMVEGGAQPDTPYHIELSKRL